ncbi:MAG: hypothetical protein OXG85_11980 [Chloroflexi bacterium]|nr:hypothetical protein [Chloroflexota bacterium]
MPPALEAGAAYLAACVISRFARGPLPVIVFAFTLALAGCDGTRAAPSETELSPTAAPTSVPSSTALARRSEALFTDQTRHSGKTSSSFASLPAGAVLPPAPSGASERAVTVLLDAGAVMRGELYRRGASAEPAILMLGADLSAWGELPLQLSEAGFVVLALQTDSVTPARLVNAMIQSLIAVRGVDAGAIGLIGEARAADLALLGCAVNTLCDALALLSPQSRETLLNMMPSFGERPLWLAASASDSESQAAALALSQAAQGQARLEMVAEGRGAAMLAANPGLSEQLLAWIALQLRGA